MINTNPPLGTYADTVLARKHLVVEPSLTKEEKKKAKSEQSELSDKLFNELWELKSVNAAGNKRKIEQLRNKLIVHNHRLVYHTVEKYFSHVAFLKCDDDLVQEGTVGLIAAIDGFNPTKGFKFSTYATVWIKNSIVNYLTYTMPHIRVPVHTRTYLNRLTKHICGIENFESGKLPELKELRKEMPDFQTRFEQAVKELKYTPETVKNLLSASELKTRQSYDIESVVSSSGRDNDSKGSQEPAGRGYNQLLNEKLTNYDMHDEKSDHSFVIDELVAHLDTLTSRNRDIFLLRFGVVNQPSAEEKGEDIE